MKGADYEECRDERRRNCLNHQGGSFKGIRPILNGENDHRRVNRGQHHNPKSTREGWAQCLSEEVGRIELFDPIDLAYQAPPLFLAGS